MRTPRHWLQERTASDAKALAKYAAGKGKHVDAGLEEELQQLKVRWAGWPVCDCSLQLRIKCSVCHVRPKSAIITKCCHMFCRECVDSNLKTRLRKCPGSP